MMGKGGLRSGGDHEAPTMLETDVVHEQAAAKRNEPGGNDTGEHRDEGAEQRNKRAEHGDRSSHSSFAAL